MRLKPLLHQAKTPFPFFRRRGFFFSARRLALCVWRFAGSMVDVAGKLQKVL